MSSKKIFCKEIIYDMCYVMLSSEWVFNLVEFLQDGEENGENGNE